jgi:CheY-like chemotaxis protein/HPt (histidine-containing phosphotransfer) domain-containing protein
MRSFNCEAVACASAKEAKALFENGAKAEDAIALVMIDGKTEDARETALSLRQAGAKTILVLPPGETPLPEEPGDVAFDAQIRKPLGRSRLFSAILQATGKRKASPKRSPLLVGNSQRKFKILLAEDNQTNRFVAISMLNRMGCGVDAVANGLEAIAALRRIPYDLVLMDCQMPEMDGYAAAKLIRLPETETINPQIPIIAMTANAMDGDRRKCLEAGMDDYLSKPVTAKYLRKALEKWLGAEAKHGLESQGKQDIDSAPDLVFDSDDFFVRLGLDHDSAKEIVAGFMGDAEAEMKNVEAAIAKEDFERLRDLAHIVKGMAANISAKLLQRAASELEEAARLCAIENAKKQAHKTKDECAP